MLALKLENRSQLVSRKLIQLRMNNTKLMESEIIYIDLIWSVQTKSIQIRSLGNLIH